MDLLAKTFVPLTLCVLLILTLNVKSIFPEALYFSNEAFGKTNTCNCVVFRLDDIKDGYLDRVQIKIMDLFISRGVHISLGLIMKFSGNDSVILNKISEGNSKGLFELALHGWEHKNYTTLSQGEQKNSLYKANEKMRMLFGKRSDIFIPPYFKFNKATLNAINDLGIKILSSSIAEENKFDEAGSIFNSTAKKQGGRTSEEIYHLPYTTDFKKFVGRSQIKVPVEKVAKDIEVKIDKFGYAIVLIHPDSFIKRDKSGNFKGDYDQAQLDEKDMKDLEFLINLLMQKGIAISSFHKILDA
jgi:peptidoglycan/xylan/chitin deacetylase (PgdA/CDA1 family)